LKSSPG